MEKEIEILKAKNEVYQEVIDFIKANVENHEYIVEFIARKQRNEKAIERIENLTKTHKRVYYKMQENSEIGKCTVSKNTTDDEINGMFEEICGGVYRWWIQE